MNVRNMQRSRLSWMLAALLLLLMAGGAIASGEQRRLDSTLYDYASTFRWGDIGQVLSFMDRSEAGAKAPTTFEVERWKQWRVVGYRPLPYVMYDKNRAEQVVEIEITNINTQTTRKLVDRQRWRYERKTKTWLLSSGLPNLSQP